MKVYYAIITDYLGQQVLKLQYTATAKHAAFLAQQYIDYCPPAAGFKIQLQVIKPNHIVELLNQGA